ncbi:MAG: methyltransferase [Pseudomonadota bacterium]
MRFNLALEAGLELPDGPIVVRHPTAETDLSAFPGAVIDTPDWTVSQAVVAQGRPLESEPADYEATVIVLPRSKDLARDLIAYAAQTTSGPIIVDGQKTDGIDSIWRACRERADVQGAVTKAHGRCFWMHAAPDIFADWVWQQPDVHGFALAPGVFSADGIDPGSYALAEVLPEVMTGHVVDLGAGWGYLSAVAQARGATRIDCVEVNAMALQCAEANVGPDRATFHWHDATVWKPTEQPDHVIMNPPFHTGQSGAGGRKGAPELGAAFIRNAAQMLGGGGHLWMVANRHLPYEEVLATYFGSVEELPGPPGTQGYKIYHATRPQTRKSAAKGARSVTRHRARG